MSAYIHSIATGVPEQSYQQQFLRDRMKEYLGGNRATERIIHRIYSASGIQKRHSIINDFNANGSARLFFEKDGSLSTPSTGNRNDLYTQYSKKLFTDVAQQLIQQQEQFDADDITHVITVSCTGFFAPEPAFEIVKKLGLSPNTQRYHLGFMGCFAAFPALKMAKAFCNSNPDATVLIICLELCTLHLQNSQKTDHLISASVFADGAAGVLVSARKPSKTAYKLDQFATAIAEDSESDMAWTIGDTGFDMVLSSYVPQIIQSNLEQSVQPLFNSYNISRDDIRHWAIHPGGRAILDKIEQSLKLNPTQLTSSRQVLADFGNMSSATILFVLKHLLDKPLETTEETVLAMAFGPGLTIESGLLTKVAG